MIQRQQADTGITGELGRLHAVECIVSAARSPSSRVNVAS